MAVVLSGCRAAGAGLPAVVGPADSIAQGSLPFLRAAGAAAEPQRLQRRLTVGMQNYLWLARHWSRTGRWYGVRRVAAWGGEGGGQLEPERARNGRRLVLLTLLLQLRLLLVQRIPPNLILVSSAKYSPCS